uniref:Protein hook homolog n=1 Tax=Saccoglossus kowalevskii TaxID=10224 RepID=A0ABM0MB58_SACKO|nr:PREDICTED: protein hook homolog [Saccoglossus kowalevskii]
MRGVYYLSAKTSTTSTSNTTTNNNNNNNKEDMINLQRKLHNMEEQMTTMEKTIRSNNQTLLCISEAQETTMSKIQKYPDSFTSLLQDSRQLQQDLKKKEKEIEQTHLENKNLQKQLDELRSSRLQDLHSPNLYNNLPLDDDDNSDNYELVTNRKKSDARAVQTMIVGDSLLRDVDIKRVYRNTHIRTLRGRKIEDIDEYIQSTSYKDIQTIVIHVGTNNISDGCSVQTCADEFVTLIDNTKHKYPTAKICVSSILHRRDNITTNENTDQLNDKLKQQSANGDNYIYIDNNNINCDTHLIDMCI